VKYTGDNLSAPRDFVEETLRMGENGTLVTDDGLLSLAEESNRKYDKPETIKPPRELSISRERHWVSPIRVAAWQGRVVL
jgi:hypothetical protein